MREFIKAGDQHIIFPFYHVVSNDALPHITHLYQARNVAAFERDMDFLLRNFTPLHFDDLVSGRFQPDTPYFHLSFDDGLAEMYHIVRPILLEKGIPATFFINSAFVNDQALMYRYKVSLLLEKVPTPDLEAAVKSLGGESTFRVHDVKRFLLQLDAAREDIIDRIATTVGFDFRSYTAAHALYMHESHMETMLKEGFTLGAHSVDHPEFAHIAPAAQMAQVQLSVDYIRNRFNSKHPPFAFPFTADGVDPSVFNTMYTEYGVSRSFGTAGLQKSRIHPQHIDRIPAEYADWPLEHVVKAEYHYFLAKKMLGR